jgi:hypothetical protein
VEETRTADRENAMETKADIAECRTKKQYIPHRFLFVVRSFHLLFYELADISFPSSKRWSFLFIE